MFGLFGKSDPPKPDLEKSAAELQAVAPGLNVLLNQLNRDTAVRDAQTSGQVARSELGLLRELGPRYAAGLRQTPEIDAATDRLLGRAADSTSELGSALNALALEELSAGGALSGAERREVDQASRAGASARGLAVAPSSLIEEILNRGQASRERLAGRQQFATAVEGQNQNRTALDDSANRGIFSLVSNFYDPQARVFANPSRRTEPVNLSQLLGLASDRDQFSRNQQFSADSQSANNAAGLLGGGISLLGGIFS
ncbi:MAG: hypothetical protein AAF555_05635 [Verrucomicrobiota bacterium]